MTRTVIPRTPQRPLSNGGTLAALATRVRRFLGGAAPGVPSGNAATPSGLTAEFERSVLDLVLRVGDAMITSGAPVADITASLLRLAHKYGVTSCYVDITFTSLTATIDRDDDPITKVRVVTIRTSDHSRLADLFNLVRDVVQNEIPLAEAHARLDAITARPHPYRRFVVTLALGAMAAGVAVLLGGGAPVAVAAAFTSMLVDRTTIVLRRLALPYLFQQVVGAGIATMVALGLLWAGDRFGWAPHLLPPSLVVASGIVVLLAGLSLVGAAQDAISGFPLTAAARSFEVALHTVGIVVGVGLVLGLGNRIGIPLRIGDHGLLTGSPAVQIVAGAVIAGAWAVASYTRPRIVGVALLIGALSAGTVVAFRNLDLGPGTAAFLAALVVGVIAGGLSERLRTPSLVMAVCGITPLLPGLAIYRAMFTLVESDDSATGLTLGLAAIGVGLALAAGVTLGDYLTTPLRRAPDRWQLRNLRRARNPAV